MMHWVQKRSLPIPALTIADPALVVAYRYWSDRRDGDFLPTRCVIDTPTFRLLVPDTMWLSKGAYSGRLAPYASATRGDGTDTTLEEALRHDVDSAFVTCVPSLQLIEVKIRECSILYQQLLLPTADDGFHANELLEVSKLGSLRLVRPGASAA
jgi:hypothetical protein